jgi:ElaB/YqjD/DUF883 family membrane-anchored ribosome-binding protein
MSASQSQNSDPDQLRREIERTRHELGETVARLAYKADVKSQAREKVQGVKAKLAAKTPDSARGGARQVAEGARQHPVPIATAGALAVGILLGRLIMRRRD